MTLIEAYEQGGWLLAAAVGVTGALRIWRLAWLQRLLPNALQWDKWELWVRYVVLFAVSLFSAVLTGLAAGKSFTVALLAAMPVAFAAHLTHKGTQAAGFALTARALKKDWQYTPSPLRRAASIVVPLNQDAIMAHNVAAKTHTHRAPPR